MNERIDPNPREITFITQRASKSPFGEQQMVHVSPHLSPKEREPFDTPIRGNHSRYMSLESPMKNQDLLVRQTTQSSRQSKVCCRICKNSNQLRQLIRVCHCDEEFEYVHKKCLHENLHDDENHRKEVHGDTFIYSCQRCQVSYPVKAESDLYFLKAWREKKSELIRNIFLILVEIIMTSVVATYSKREQNNNLRIGLIVLLTALSLVLIVSFLVTCKLFIYTHWTFIDRFTKESFQSHILQSWIWHSK